MPLRIERTDYESRVYLAMNYITRNIERELALDEIASSAAFSPFHFHRIFKAVAGENVGEFARRLRLELAASRLAAYPRDDVTSIALSSGFSSSQNFAKAFKLRYGTTPSGYRAARASGAPGLASAPGRPGPRPAARDAAVREMAPAKAATIRRIGAYAATCPAAFRELLSWARGRITPGPGSLMALYWDNPEVTPEERCRFDCCLLVPDGPSPEGIADSGEVFLQEVGGGPWGICRFEVEAEGIRGAWESAFLWLVQSGWECRPIPCCEIYHNDARFHPENKWIIEIAIPLKAE